MTNTEQHNLPLERFQKTALGVGAAGLGLSLVGAFMNAQQFFMSYLTAYMFCLSLCVGALFLVFLHHLFDASWSVPIRRVTEQISCLLFPWMLILLVPNSSREVLSLALQQGDRLVVSLMASGDEDPTAGFTYWDFEDLFKSDREEVLGGGQ